jgi:hypothetical protein
VHEGPETALVDVERKRVRVRYRSKPKKEREVERVQATFAGCPA